MTAVFPQHPPQVCRGTKLLTSPNKKEEQQGGLHVVSQAEIRTLSNVFVARRANHYTMKTRWSCEVKHMRNFKRLDSRVHTQEVVLDHATCFIKEKK